MVERHVGSHRQAARLGGGDHLHRAGTGQLPEVGAHATLFHQQQVTGQGDGLRGLRDAGEPQEAGGGPFVGQAAVGQIGVQGGKRPR